MMDILVIDPPSLRRIFSLDNRRSNVQYCRTTCLKPRLTVKAITRASCVEYPMVSQGVFEVPRMYHVQ